MRTNYKQNPLTEDNLYKGKIVYEKYSIETCLEVLKLERVTKIPPSNRPQEFLITTRNLQTGKISLYPSSTLIEIIEEKIPYEPEKDQNPPIS